MRVSRKRFFFSIYHIRVVHNTFSSTEGQYLYNFTATKSTLSQIFPLHITWQQFFSFICQQATTSHLIKYPPPPYVTIHTLSPPGTFQDNILELSSKHTIDTIIKTPLLPYCNYGSKDPSGTNRGGKNHSHIITSVFQSEYQSPKKWSISFSIRITSFSKCTKN